MPYIPTDSILSNLPNEMDIYTNISGNQTMSLNIYQHTLSNVSFWKDIYCAKKDVIIDFCKGYNIILNYDYIIGFAIINFLMIFSYFILGYFDKLDKPNLIFVKNALLHAIFIFSIIFLGYLYFTFR
jgi:hypothetical protein